MKYEDCARCLKINKYLDVLNGMAENFQNDDSFKSFSDWLANINNKCELSATNRHATTIVTTTTEAPMSSTTTIVNQLSSNTIGTTTTDEPLPSTSTNAALNGTEMTMNQTSIVYPSQSGYHIGFIVIAVTCACLLIVGLFFVYRKKCLRKKATPNAETGSHEENVPMK